MMEASRCYVCSGCSLKNKLPSFSTWGSINPWRNASFSSINLLGLSLSRRPNSLSVTVCYQYQQKSPPSSRRSDEKEDKKNNGKRRRSTSTSKRSLNVRGLQQGDPLGRRDLGKQVVRWISQGMRGMASDFAKVEIQGNFFELEQRIAPGLTFLMEAQPYLSAVPMPLGLEAICLKAGTHYPTIFDYFQRELRDVLQGLQAKSMVEDWRETQSWKLLKCLANSAQHKTIARKTSQPKPTSGALGLDTDKVKAIQSNIDQFTKHMANLLHIERDAELEFTQEELNAMPMPVENSDSTRPIEFLVTHGQSQQELCDTLCNLIAVNTSTGILAYLLQYSKTSQNL